MSSLSVLVNEKLDFASDDMGRCLPSAPAGI